jgi:integrase
MKKHQRNLMATISEFKHSQDAQDYPEVIKHLQTALKWHVLPFLDSSFHPNKLKPQDFKRYCSRLPINRLSPDSVLDIFEKSFDAAVAVGQLSKSTKGNYSSALGRFLAWMRSQTWYLELFPQPLSAKAPAYVRVNGRKPRTCTRQEREYGLRKEELPLPVIGQLEDWENFWIKSPSSPKTSHQSPTSLSETSSLTQEQRRLLREERRNQAASSGHGFEKPRVDKINLSTIKRYSSNFCRFWGWCVHFEGYDLKEINMELLTDPIFLQDYADWLISKRGCSYSEAAKLVQAAISVAKWLTFDQSHRRDWSDIPIVIKLQALRATYTASYRQEKPQLDEQKWSDREINHSQARCVVQYLYQCCAKLSDSGGKRRLSALVEAWQVYLMVKILVYAPVRQEELRKLRLGNSLLKVKDSLGIERYAVRIKNHKNFNKTGKFRYYPLPSVLTQDLDTWLNIIRPMAIESTQTLESWLEFWGRKESEVEQLQKRLEQAVTGSMPYPIKNKENYMAQLNKKLSGLKTRIAHWEKAASNASVCDHVFFTLGGNRPTSFAKPYDDDHLSCITGLVSRAVGRATKALFGQECFLNPHGFRNIGSKHLRKCGKGGHKDAFSALAGHSVEIDDKYAAQITSDYELIEDIVDDWWEENRD